MKLSLKFKELKVEMDDGVYVLREMDGLQREEYRKVIAEQAVVDAEGKPTGFKDEAVVKTKLLILCLWNPAGVLVTKEVVNAYPAAAHDALFKAAVQLNMLKEVEGNG